MRLVVDAKVAIKWFVRENLHAEARHLLVRDEALFAPDFLAIELAINLPRCSRCSQICFALHVLHSGIMGNECRKLSLPGNFKPQKASR